MSRDDPELVIPLTGQQMLNPLPVTGYTPQPPLKVEAVNRSKELENRLGDFIASLRNSSVEVDEDMIGEAVRHLRTGFMYLNRAVFQPETRLR